MKSNSKSNSKIIPASLLFPEINWSDVKIHVAQKADSTRPIDVFTRNFDEWQNDWNGSYHSNHCWNRKYIFSIIELPSEPNRWLFGGIFRVISYKSVKDETGKDWIYYKVDLESQGESLIGRLTIQWVKDARGKGRKPESMLSNMSVSEILPEPYAGEEFPGYANINHSYSTLEKIWKDSKPDWFTALAHCQGVYLITDAETGLRYVGSAYGEEGIWSRWSSYFLTGGHGNNKLLKKLLKGKSDGEDYARKYFQFCLLEQSSSRDSEQHILTREVFWKQALMTRGKFGLNDN
jgi:hypothetical protein